MDTISARELEQYIGNPNYLLIDLRPADEYRQGHIPGAVNAPQGEYENILKRRYYQCLILYCDRGAASMVAARELEMQGYRVKSVVGGYHAYRQRKK